MLTKLVNKLNTQWTAQIGLLLVVLWYADNLAPHPLIVLAQSSPSHVEQERIDIVDFKYTPDNITVPVGTELTWTNKDSAPHTVTADNDSFDSGSLIQDDTFSVTLEELGIVEYICTIHPSMRGSINVVEESETSDAVQVYLPFLESIANSSLANPTATNQTSTIPPGSTATPTATPSPTPEAVTTPIALQRWSDPATWGGSVPVAGEVVTIPAGQTVLLDVSPPTLNSLMIDGELHFDNVDLNLTAGWIMVRGKLQAGTTQQPYAQNANITLTGTSQPNTNIMGMGDKVLGALGNGQIRLHGLRKTSWLRLNQTANKGDTTLTLDSAPDWQVGDQIVVASTDFDYRQAETFTIAAINGTQISLDRPLDYMHWGEMQSFNGQSLDQRAEVGLLSRNILIQGTAGAESDGVGGHIMLTGSARLSLDGVELYRMGQRAGLGRYPIHFHVQGDGSRGSYVKNSSIHHTFNRCLTIHGSNGILVDSVVAYDAPGHCFFLEDAAEFDNVFENNLGLGVYKPEGENRLLRSDTEFRGPAVYWITNPQNTFRNNVAAGSEGTGFWIALPDHPTGISYTETVWPVRMPMNEFSGNVSHSNDTDGLHVDGGPTGDEDGSTESTYYAAYADPNNTDSAILPVTFANMTVYKNRNNGVWLRGESHILDGAVVADNARGVTFASEDTIAQNSLFVGESANVGQPEPYMIEQGQIGTDGRTLPFPWNKEFPIRGFEFYDGTIGVINSHFANFAANSLRNAGALSYLDFTDFAVSPLNYAQGLSFGNGTKRVFMATRPTPANPAEGTEDGYRTAVFLDQDGSVTGSPNQYVVVDNPLLVTDACTKQTEWNVWICPQTSYVGLIVLLNSAEVNSVSFSRAGHTHTMFGAGTSPGTYFRGSILSDEEHEITFDDHIPSTFRVVLQYGANKPVMVRVPNYTQYPEVSLYERELPAASSLAELRQSANTGFYYDTNAADLYLLLASDEDYLALKVRQGGTPPPITGSGIGLSGAYYDNVDFAGAPVTRVDASINFRWQNAPLPSFPEDNFTVRWTGQVEAPARGDYTFEISADDSVRLWVCGEQLVEHWEDGYDPGPRFGTVTMAAGQQCEIQIDFREYTAWGHVQLWWQFGEYARQIVPPQQLYP